ncbi:hypothetical protein BDV25DRAFT_163789 [Aspergillus avenaceus]|uniref:C2H2-type domain-containing protein n=1 Tax=Aspergillus avenaceus TaxID=36643 RepID=A0A5N6THK6_ASPAV|nr:hypothetical protein BDV25DRAFT_163789 [Aspergillus avenaceus]
MGTALDALTTPQPLSSRRPAAPSLPSFELPPPNFHPVKYHSHPTHPQPPTNPSVNSLLTPPASTQSGETPIATTATALTSTAGSASADPASSYQPYWQGQNTYTSASAAPRQSWTSTVNPPYPARETFSPSVSNLSRNPATSPPGADTLPSQPYDMNQLPPFQQPLTASVPPQHHSMTHAMLTAQNALPNPPPAPPSLPSNDPYMTKSSSAPAYAGIQPMTSPAAYAPYGQPGLGIHPPGRVASNPHTHHLNYQRQPWPSYSLPAMNGPVMTNVHNPNGHMSPMGNLQPGLLGFNSGYVASMQAMCPPHPGHAPGPTNDRPFKCDQCPQSFNRNHDLKRHKRIHLSVKPFPCTHCDKSFSRKDALKRHILVKGCGKDVTSDAIKPEHQVKQEDKELDPHV